MSSLAPTFSLQRTTASSYCVIRPAEGKTVAMKTAVVPGVDAGVAEVEGAGADAGVGVARPVVAVGTATAEVTGVPGEVPAPEEGERNILYQSV